MYGVEIVTPTVYDHGTELPKIWRSATSGESTAPDGLTLSMLFNYSWCFSVTSDPKKLKIPYVRNTLR